MPTLPLTDESKNEDRFTPAQVALFRARHGVEKTLVPEHPKDFRFVALLVAAVIATSRAPWPLGPIGSVAVVLIGLDMMRSRK